MNIICVDDHPVMLKGLSQNIKRLLPDASISIFESSDEAYAFAKENVCDVLVCEIELRGVDGITLANKIKGINPEVNIIFHTVCDEKEHAREVMRVKPSGYLVKPARVEQLEVELKSLRYNTCAV